MDMNSRLFALDEDGKLFFPTVAELAEVLSVEAPPPEPEPDPDPVPEPVPGTVDLVVENITWTPATPVPGDEVKFHAQVRNIGTGTMPGGTVAPHETVSVAFYIDGNYATWSDDHLGSLEPNQAVTVTANGGPWEQGAVWIASPGGHTVTAHVNDMNRKQESNYENNKFSKPLTVGEPPPFPEPTGVLPNASNTGPRQAPTGTITMQQWIAAGHAERKVITGVHDDQAGILVDKVLTATDCEFTEFYYIEPYEVGPTHTPIIGLEYCTIQGKFTHQGPSRMTMDHVHCVRQSYVTAGRAWLEGFRDHEPNQTPRFFPWKISNSWFHAERPAMPPAQAHSEGLHMVGACVGPEFRNVRVSQDGNNGQPLDNNITGIIKSTSIDGLWEDCQFDWNGTGPSSYFSLNMEGRNNRMVRCKAEGGVRAFFFNSDVPPEPRVFSPIGGGGANNYTTPVLTDCHDLKTGLLLNSKS